MMSATALEGVDLLRGVLASRPILLCVACLVCLVAGRRQGSLERTAQLWMAGAVKLLAIVGLLGLVAYPAAAFWYASDPHYLDNAEPTVPAIGWLFTVGQPLYHSTDSAERYTLIYGPLAYIFYGFVLRLLGPGLVMSKALGAGAGVASLAFVFAAVRRHGSPLRAAVLTGMCAVLLLAFRQYSFWTRPDPLQLLSAAAALFFAVSGSGYTSAALVGVVSGVLWDLKFTGPLYSLPVFWLLHRRAGWRGTVLASSTAIVVAIAPFWFQNVSLTNYLFWIRSSAGTGTLLSMLRQNLEWALFLGAAVLLSHHAVPAENRVGGRDWSGALVATAIGACGLVIAAAKPGAGPYHLIPLFPVVTYLAAWQAAAFSLSRATKDPVVPRAAVAFLVVAVAIAAIQQLHLATSLLARKTLHEAEDIEQFASTHDGVVEMGYGRTEALSLVRPVLVFRNNTYFIDQPAVREHQLAGVEIPPATVAALASCRINYWLIPKGEAPFSGINGYTAVFGRPLYPPAFRQAFESAYKRVGNTTYYDVWQCQPRTGT
jgi:hypothetical protein